MRQGQRDVSAVTADEAGDGHGQRLAFQIGRQAGDDDRDVGIAHRCHRLVEQRLGGRHPEQAEAFVVRHMVQRDRDGLGRAVAVHRHLDAALGQRAVVQHLAAQRDAGAVVRGAILPALRLVDDQAVLAGAGGDEFAGPVRLERADWQAGRDGGAVEIEVDAAVLPGDRRGAAIIGAQAGLAARAQGGFGDDDRGSVGERGALRIADVGGAEARAYAVERGDRADRGAVVIALKHAEVVGVSADDRDLRAGLQRQPVGGVLEQHDRLAGRLQRDRLMGGRADLIGADAAVRAGAAERDAQRLACAEGAGERGVDLGLGDQALFQRLGQRGIGAAAIDVGAAAHRRRRAAGGVEAIMVIAADVADRVAVRHRKAGKAPVAAQALVHQRRRGAGGDAMDAVIGAHQRHRPAFGDRAAEGGEIGRFEIAWGRIDVEAVAAGFGAAVDGEVLRRGDDARVGGVGPLQPLHERDAQCAGEIRVLAVRLLPAAPARIAEDVDVGRPDGEALVDAAVRGDGLRIELGARLGRDDGADLPQQIGVPGGGKADRLREDGRLAVAGEAVEAFVPPVVGGQADGGIGGRGALQLRGLLFGRHRGDGGGDGVGRLREQQEGGDHSGAPMMVRATTRRREEGVRLGCPARFVTPDLVRGPPGREGSVRASCHPPRRGVDPGTGTPSK